LKVKVVWRQREQRGRACWFGPSFNFEMPIKSYNVERGRAYINMIELYRYYGEFFFLDNIMDRVFLSPVWKNLPLTYYVISKKTIHMCILKKYTWIVYLLTT
jgi:hypothetical protein